MTSISDLVKDWYSQEDFWNKNSSSLDPNDFDLKLINKDLLIKDKVVLNLGCFYPRVELFLSYLAKSWTAIDFSEEVIRKCKQFQNLKHVNFKLIDMTKLSIRSDLGPNSFDTILDISSGDHIPLDDYKKMVGDIYHLLKSGGYFVTSYANLDYGTKEENYALHGYERWIKPKDLYKIMQDNGFIITYFEANGPRSGVVCQKGTLPK